MIRGFSLSRPVLLLCVLNLLLPASVPAGEDNGRTSANGVSLEGAVDRARSQYRGRVLSAETRGNGQGGTHNIRILTNDGRVRRVQVDPRTGKTIIPGQR